MKIMKFKIAATLVSILFCFTATDAQNSLLDSLRGAILTPPPPETPRVNGPSVFGVRPGSPFYLYHSGNRSETYFI